MTSILHFIQLGGIMMIPLLIIIFAAFVLIVERYLTLKKYITQLSLINPFLEAVQHQNFDAARFLIENQSGPVIEVLKHGLDHFLDGNDVLTDALKSAFYEHIEKLNKSLTTIQVLGALMPMLGLLGTINGMIHIFGAVSVMGLGDAQGLAKGISEALITTETGLAGAIPVIFFHNYLANMAERLVLDIKRAAYRLLHLSNLHQKG